HATPTAAATLPPTRRAQPTPRRWRYSNAGIRRCMPERGGEDADIPTSFTEFERSVHDAVETYIRVIPDSRTLRHRPTLQAMRFGRGCRLTGEAIKRSSDG